MARIKVYDEAKNEWIYADSAFGASGGSGNESSGEGGSTTLEPLTFEGAVSGVYDGTQPLTVEIPTGGGGKWETINTITLAEDSNAVIIDKDSNGNDFELSAFMFYIDRVATDLQTNSGTLYIGKYIWTRICSRINIIL